MAITQNELNISNKSYTNKDFRQIYPELLDLCLKLTNQWNPDQSNESDPGIVLIKLAAFIADKNNYNIDKNTLECFMPSATQESSMRNLCEMNGYSMGYYKSAITPISFMYTNTIAPQDSFTLKKYDTVITSEDGSIKYTLIEDCNIAKINETKSAEAIEGTLETLTVGDSNIIQLSNLDDNNRIYFPKKYVAENGIFITNTNGNNLWARKNNLNIEELGQTIFKFGYDSSQQLPYVEFPSDIISLIDDGLIIRYVISSGLAGNVSSNTLTVLSAPSSVTTSQGEEKNDLLDYLVINNLYSTNDGVDPETIDEAYNSFKKTVGTFNTLVTCRDYANFIYNLVDETTLKYIVSNIQVADRRTDLNYSNNVVTYGLQEGKYTISANENAGDIQPFDLCLYPFSPITTNYNASTYVTSFKPIISADTVLADDPNLKEAKCLSHNYKKLQNNDTFCIKNYYKLNVKLSTYERLNNIQQQSLIDTVKNALYRDFNARNVDFGEEIPYDSILKTIKEADNNISNVILSEPELTTYVMNPNGTEYPLLNTSGIDFVDKARRNIVAKNVLSGTISLFDFNTNYSIEFGQKALPNYDAIYSKLSAAKSEVKISSEKLDYEYILNANEIIQFIAPNLATDKEYGSYVNYRFDPDSTRNYTLLTVEPIDWIDNYKNYFKLDTEGNYVALTEREIFVPNTYYSGAYTHSQVIPSNTYYQLSGQEKLTFIYTDAETNIEHTVIYTATTINLDGTLTEGVTNIFKTSLDVRPVEAFSTPSVVVKNGIKYLTLGVSDTICREIYVNSILDNSTLPCYWIMNNETNTLFDVADIKNKKISVLLNNGEYFMYSNNASTELVILGSGTKLTIDLSAYEDPATSFSSWTIDNSNMLNIDEINNHGLAAFGATNWQNKTLSVTPIKVEDMQIKSYSEFNRVRIRNCTNTEFINNGLSNDWVSLDNAKIECSVDGTEEQLQTFMNLTYEGQPIYWSCRSRLDLNCGPNKVQQLRSNQTIWLKNLLNEEYEIKGSDSTTGIDTNISFNVNVQFAGSNDWIDIKSRTVDGVKISLTDGVEGLLYNKITNKYPISNKEAYSGREILRNNNGMLPLNLSGFGASIASKDPIELNYINFGNLQSELDRKEELIFMYYDATIDESTGKPISTLTITSDGLIRHYGDSSSSTSLTLDKGINTISIPVNSTSTYFKFNHNVACDDVVYIGKLSLINGLNKRIKDSLPEDESSILSVINDLATVDNKNIFYYTDNVIADKEMDVDNLLTPDAFWDPNNIANKFTIGEIRFDIPEEQEYRVPQEQVSEFSILKSSQK